MNGLWLLRVVLIASTLTLSSCKDNTGNTSQISDEIIQQPAITLLDSQVIINDYVVVSSRRVGRTVSEYTLRAIATNISSTRYTNVIGTLTSVPSNITVVDGAVVFGTVAGNGDTTSADEFIITVDLTVKTSLDELVWRVEGTVPGTGGGGGSGSPEQVGIFMSIDENSQIKGDSVSKSHEDWIELLSFSEGSSIVIGSGSGGDRPTGKVNFDGVTVSKNLDSSSPKLRQTLADGDIFTEVKIDIIKICDASLYTAYAITLTVSSLTALEMTSSASDQPNERLAFNYSRIETMYTPVGPGCRFEAPIYSYQDALGIK